MIFGKKTSKPANPKPKKEVTAQQATLDFIKASKEFECSRIQDIERSKKIAWYVAITSCVLSICLTISITTMLPLKEVRPFLVRVDNNTGVTDIVTMLENGKSDYGEEVDRYFASLFVQKLESYDWYTIQSQFNQVMMFSNNDVKNNIKNIFNSPNAPHKLYQDKQRVDITINSISRLDKHLLQVRFIKKISPMNGGTYDPTTDKTNPEPILEKRIATLAYEYQNVPTVDDIRRVNPLGFTVISYKVDQDGSF